ncbi:hypothetical protein APHWI1_0316 [Anaplasma phagocytophilum str. ApWI1]|uniref:Uncharacterized protein n=2 Tax=Anaplasma phagocytophilum TaxID=948 RepID=A0A0F3N5A2_ANAPH|nr:hypothetical protein APHWEB_1199 [Anaplasma phagocytophilum str. Webster]KJV63273.1 hypothetical protein EPHNCH_1137 [Anaplasma phagocytophilum str. NCH-1]KJV82368.1 hypothetical protein APHHGE2_1114 [Anaplasma phagocytophilum str. HGE2]KJV84287.1 hypothetical protein APHWI1_0316 [Anaplasma phagocytophilum str. ApWI1]KJV86987.1 hypothetical protein APHNYW_0828 [Anaplasma phagocytophilum str. ApNYW]KJV98660.1 hypothetical protein OTSANNIE_1088 [Anaplasma phagocytophilum str. Annie]KJZ98621.
MRISICSNNVISKGGEAIFARLFFERSSAFSLNKGIFKHIIFIILRNK